MSQPADATPDLIGRTLGRYRVDAFIGEGGMGRVYRAFDPALGRAVAIKILPQDLVNDRDRLERFIREARTASSLNHPNVVTIYEIGSAGQLHFIAMELLEGETLRERLMRGKMELRRAIDTIAQVADGVAAAHSAGVIHRDLKPENIVITKSGFAKILDFGLAKLREGAPPAEDGATAKKTDPGTVLGSAGYMSPEQAAGREVDHRSDIFSLGCILYEAIAGRRAFSGDSSIDTLHKIVYDDPPPLRDIAPDTPAELQRIVRKLLAKDPDERYQSAKDLSIDLRNLRREIESQPHGVGPALAGRPSRNRALWIGAIVVALLIIAAVVIPLRRKSAAKPSAPMSVTRITASGNVIGAAISPDGEYIAYAYSDAGKHSLLVRQLSSGSVLQLVPPSPIGMWGLSFSPDSRSVYYAIKSRTDPSGALYVIPILGGSPRRLLTRIESSVAFSPDGKRFAFTRINVPSPGQSQIIIANADGTSEKALITKSPPNLLAPVFWGAPAWSPDGKLIAASLRAGREFTATAFSVDDGHERALTHDRWSFVGQLAWLHDMSGLMLIGGRAGTDERKLWMVSYPDGQRRQITNDLFDYRMVSLSADEKSLVTVASDQTSSIWLAPLSGGSQPKRLTDGKYDGLVGVAAAADGVVFTSLDSGRWDLWSIDRSGNNRRPLTTSTTEAIAPALSPDGRYVLYATPQDGDWAFVRANRDGSEVKKLCAITTTGRSRWGPFVTPDNRFVIFDDAPDGVSRLWKVSIDGGNPTAVGREGVAPAVSPDGKWIAYMAGFLRVASLTNSSPPQTFTSISPNNFSMVRWTPDGKALLHNAGLNDRKNIWLQPIDGAAPRPITQFDDQYVLGFDMVPGGKELVVVRGILSRDAVLIKNFR